jgi:hypothetical protein
MTNEHPNRYRENALVTIDHPRPNFQPVVRIKRKWYKASLSQSLS